MRLSSSLSARKHKVAFKADAQWLKTRELILKNIKDQVQHRLGPEPAEIRKYSTSYQRQMRRRWTASNKAELLTQIDKTNIVYGGDFHAHAQVQRTHLRILRALSDERPVILALEAFSYRKQKVLDAYLNGKLTEKELREKSQWDKEWGFPWEHYRPLFELAKQRKFRLLGLNQTHKPTYRDLQKRDRHAAQLIVDAVAKNPNALVYVLMGDLHLAPQHLPAEVKKRTRKKIKDLIIYLNPEKIYFQLAKKGLESFLNVVRLSRNEFGVISSPPWVQWQSYLMFLEQTVDEDLDDEFAEEGFDYTDHVAQMIELVCRDLNVKISLDDLAVYSARDGKIWRSLKKALKTKELKIAEHLIETGRSFVVPQAGVCYLSQATVNHAAEVAGHYLHGKLSRRKRLLWTFPEDFQALIWVEAVGFFISKLVNHQRHGGNLSELKSQLAFTNSRDQSREALLLAMDQRMSELIYFHQKRRRTRRVRPRRSTSYLEAARILGAMMGERLYVGLRSRKLLFRDVIKWLQLDVTSTKFSDRYFELVTLFGPQLDGKKSKKERL